MSRDVYAGSIRALVQRFATLPAPGVDALRGVYRARFIGPRWLRALGGPSVALGGLPGWYGKRFLTSDTATNVLHTRSGVREALSMTVVVEPSMIDGRPSATLLYGSDAPVPWRWVRDELRALDERADRLLGMTVVDVALVRRLAFPFLLEREA